MNPKNTKSPHATTRPPHSGDEPDDPGPSTSGDPPQPGLRIAGEAAGEIDAVWLRDHLAQAARLIAVQVKSLNIEIVHDARMTQLHGEHLGIAETTDVLTFPSSDSGGEPIEADIVVCLDEARWRADQFEHAVERELLLYALHGLLHCAGFDDHDEEAFAAMHAEEDRILEAIGVGRTFWAASAPAPGSAGVSAAAGHDAATETESVNSGHAWPRDRGSRDRGIDD